MERERKIKVLSLVVLIVAVLGLIVAFAVLSQTLTINGGASIDAAAWDIHFDEISLVKISGDAKEVSKPIIEDKTKVKNINVSLTKPGDIIEYKIKVTNSGNINALLKSQTLNGLKMTAQEDSLDKICSNSGFSSDETQCLLSWAKNTFLTADWNDDGTTTDEEYLKAMQNIYWTIWERDDGTFLSLDLDSELNAGDSKNLGIEVYFLSDSTELPKGSIIFNVDFIAEFIQN